MYQQSIKHNKVKKLFCINKALNTANGNKLLYQQGITFPKWQQASKQTDQIFNESMHKPSASEVG